MPKQMLAEVTDGMSVQMPALLKQKRLVPYKNKTGSFLALTLVDRSGSLEGKIFDGAEEAAARLAEGQVITIAGRASVYQGTLGLILETAEPCGEAVNPADFLPAYTGDVAALEARLDELIASVRDHELSAILHGIFDDPDIRGRFCLAPAAKGMHGAYLHGLLEHVVRQAGLAEAACRCYPQANRDLVIAGVLLHDLGKIIEFSYDLNIDYTDLGRLQGHATIGDRLVFVRGSELGNISNETAMQLSHLILSHHGEREFGAVTLPQTLEAVILHGVDNLEAKASHCIEMLAAGNTADVWTEYDRIEGRYWFRGTSTTPSPK